MFGRTVRSQLDHPTTLGKSRNFIDRINEQYYLYYIHEGMNYFIIGEFVLEKINKRIWREDKPHCIRQRERAHTHTHTHSERERGGGTGKAKRRRSVRVELSEAQEEAGKARRRSLRVVIAIWWFGCRFGGRPEWWTESWNWEEGGWQAVALVFWVMISIGTMQIRVTTYRLAYICKEKRSKQIEKSCTSLK